MASVDEQAAAYDASRGRIDELVRRLDDDRLATTVPCCPAWTVKDLVGHLTGLLEDRLASRLPTSDFTGWTDAQVARHADEPVDVVLDTWHALPVAMTDDPPSLSALSFDAVTHEHDLFYALGALGDHDTTSVRIGAKRAEERMGSLLPGAGAPGVRLRTGDDDLVIEGASPPLTLTTSTYAFMRLVTGRLSRAQAEAFAWDGEPTPVLDALFADGFFTLQPTDVLEPDLR